MSEGSKQIVLMLLGSKHPPLSPFPPKFTWLALQGVLRRSLFPEGTEIMRCCPGEFVMNCQQLTCCV